jgi:YfiR/HmsC-like
MMHWKFTRALVRWLILGMLVLAPCCALAQDDGEPEYRVKLAFLYNFTQFIEWPTEAFSAPAAPLVICVAGRNPFQGEVDRGSRRRTADGHPIQIKQLGPTDDPRACQMIFVRSSAKRATGKMLEAVRGSSTLTVGESADFAAQGGVINFTLAESRLGFEINLDAALQTRAVISSKLLALAKIIKARAEVGR